MPTLLRPAVAAAEPCTKLPARTVRLELVVGRHLRLCLTADGQRVYASPLLVDGTDVRQIAYIAPCGSYGLVVDGDYLWRGAASIHLGRHRPQVIQFLAANGIPHNTVDDASPARAGGLT
ncbi:hypothetical protein [Lysobacter enzymogenes]|uniref:hypothetical protein n=1 Tax=Lysobacter enzymogenes TaxID=69 RepID=UPI00099BF89E|nr:hypothetical protein [Lysobacter enzymogenes]UZW62735.1 hypothetical protein BV903_010770 [Lysobacter enzymogenes]